MKTLLVRGLLAVTLLLTFVLPAWAQDGKGIGVVTALTGQAGLKRPQAPEAPLKLRDNLFVRDVVDTQKETVARILLMGKSTVTVRELSRFEIREETRPDGSQRALINLAEGKIRVMVARRLMRPGDEVEIRTPNAVAGVRGSDGVIEVSKLPDGRPLTVITGASGEFQVTLPTTPPFIAREKEFLERPALASSAPLIAMVETVSDAPQGLQVAQLPVGLAVTALVQAQITGFAGAQALAQALLSQTQLNLLLATYLVRLAAAGLTQPPAAAQNTAASRGLAAAQTAALVSGARPGLGGLPGSSGRLTTYIPPITPVTGQPRPTFSTQNGGNGVTVVPFSGPIIASQTFGLTFSSATEVKTFSVVTSGTTWFVSVRDCCVAGDKWKAEIIRAGAVLTSVTGSGSISTFSDPVGVSSTGSKTFDVKVRYTTGVDAFPAGMDTKFDTTKGSITVTPR